VFAIVSARGAPSADYEAQQIRALGKIIANGHLYRAQPVHWCLDCRSALAEAESNTRIAPPPPLTWPFAASIAPISRAQRPGSGGARRRERVARHLDDHALDAARQRGGRATRRIRIRLHAGGAAQWTEVLVLAAELAPASLARFGLEGREIGRCRGAQLEGLKLRHPWLAKQVPLILGEHVTLEAGTGRAHRPRAWPGDFAIGRTYELPVVNRWGPDGCFAPGTELVPG